MSAEIAPNLRPMAEAVQFWKDKVVLPEEQYAQLADAAKTKAFFMKGLAEQTMVKEAFQHLGRAIEAGLSFGEFKKQLGDVMDRSGWGRKGRTWRLRTVFNTNILQAYGVGRYSQMMQAADPQEVGARPFWQYDAVNDSATRPSHRALDGKVFAASDPVWDSIYPPNGFNCRCTVRTLTRTQARGRGVEKGEDVLGSVVSVDGKAVRILADRGWDFNPGKVHWGDPLVRQLVTEQGSRMSWKPLGEWEELAKDEPMAQDDEVLDVIDGLRNVSGMSDEVLDAWRNAVGGVSPVLSDILGRPVLLSERMLEHLAEKAPGQSRLAFVNGIRPTLQRPAEVWLQPMMRSDGKVALRHLYIKMFSRGPYVVATSVQDGLLYGLTAFPRSKMPKRRGYALYRR